MLARVEFLEAENQKLKDSASTTQPKLFRLEHIANDDSLIRFYTGFPSYEIFVAVFDFLALLLISFTTGVLMLLEVASVT